MRAPIGRLRKSEILWLANNRCRHNHSYLEHYTCVDVEQPDSNPINERVAFLDIETSNLNADFGYIFSYCMLDDKQNLIQRVLTKKEVRSYIFDKDLMKDFVRDIKPYHRLVVYWGKNYRHDIPFLRSRALKWGVSFPTYAELCVTDVFDIVKSKLKLHRNRLATACQFFNIPAKSHPLNPDVWQKACAGDTKSLDYILTHNVEDVESLGRLYPMLIQFIRRSNTSI